MGLSNEEIRREIRERRKKSVIAKAILHQQRLKFHTETHVSEYSSIAVNDFLCFVKSLLPNDKYRLFASLFRFPVKTNEVTGIIFDRLSRIFDGRNPAISFQFTSQNELADWLEYRRVKLKEPNVWSTVGWEYYKTEPNSVLVVDLPKQQDSDMPEPYFYWVSIDRVIAYSSHPVTGEMRWIIFHNPDNTITVIDDEQYRVYEKGEDGNIGRKLRSDADTFHRLGYCPARFFIDEPISLAEPDVKASPLTKELDALDWYLYFAISKKHLDLYAAYPIYSGYQQECDYTDPITGDQCDGGFLRDNEGHYRIDAAGQLLPCPKCSHSNIAGVGSFVTVPVPHKDESGYELPDMRNPVQILTIDKNSLEYNVEEEERLKENIINACCGTAGEIIHAEALNETQVQGNFDTQTSILNREKKKIEGAQKFVDDTICKLRYGDSFISSNINYGNDFYLNSPYLLRQRYTMAKNAGAPKAELDSLYRQIIETEYHNDDIAMQRMKLLFELEPFRHSTDAEVMEMYKEGIISKEDMMLKVNFINYINRYEREYLDILASADVKYAERIRRISAELRRYVKEDININS